jgi:hypothetical protein
MSVGSWLLSKTQVALQRKFLYFARGVGGGEGSGFLALEEIAS